MTDDVDDDRPPDWLDEPPSRNGHTRPRLPADEGAERSLLGAMLLTPKAIDQATPLVCADDYYRPSHAIIHQAIVDLHGNGTPVDAQTVASLLGPRGQLDQVGGVTELGKLVAEAGITGHAHAYAQTIATCATSRRITLAGHDITQAAAEHPPDVAAAIARDLIDRAQPPAGDHQPRPLAATLHGWIDRLEQFYENGGDPTAIPTGLRSLDQRLAGGVRPGQLVIVAARPSQGKSAVAANLALNAAKDGRRVLFASLEMTTDEITSRFMSILSGMGLQQLRSGDITANQWHETAVVIGRLNVLPITIYEYGSLTVADLDNAVRTTRPDVVIVDYLQLMLGEPGRRYGTREEEVAHISRGLKRVALNRSVPVIAAAQLNREIERRASKRPTLADLRESGAIEQDADVVIGVYQEPDNPDRRLQMALITLKQRNGPVGEDWVEWHPDFTRIQNRARI